MATQKAKENPWIGLIDRTFVKLQQAFEEKPNVPVVCEDVGLNSTNLAERIADGRKRIGSFLTDPSNTLVASPSTGKDKYFFPFHEFNDKDQKVVQQSGVGVWNRNSHGFLGHQTADLPLAGTTPATQVEIGLFGIESGVGTDKFGVFEEIEGRRVALEEAEKNLPRRRHGITLNTEMANIRAALKVFDDTWLYRLDMSVTAANRADNECVSGDNAERRVLNRRLVGVRLEQNAAGVVRRTAFNYTQGDEGQEIDVPKEYKFSDIHPNPDGLQLLDKLVSQIDRNIQESNR